MPTFSPDVVAAVLAHMNDDHRDDSLLIVRAFGEPRAESAQMTGLDDREGWFGYTFDGEQHEVRVPWSTTIGERSEIRREIVMLYDAACARLGLEPRPH